MLSPNLLSTDMTYRRSFNEAVLTLQETGVISRLQTKWWTEKRDGGKCKVGTQVKHFFKLSQHSV